MLMANNKMYENYLMHYRTPGSKNGYTKYPGKYQPVGQKAQYVDDEYRKNIEYNTKKNDYSVTTAPSSNSSNIYKSNGPTTFTYDPNSGKTVLVGNKSGIKPKSPDYSKIFTNSVKNGRELADFIVEDTIDRAKRGASNAKDFGGFMAKDIASRAKSAAKKGRDFTDFVVEDNIDRAKKLVGKGKKKVSKLLKKFF